MHDVVKNLFLNYSSMVSFLTSVNQTFSFFWNLIVAIAVIVEMDTNKMIEDALCMGTILTA